MTKWLLIFVVFIVRLIASSSITTDDQVVVESHAILNASDHQQHSSHKTHHGVQVASFRFEEVRAPLVLCTFIILIALFKIIYHHTKYLSAYFPESCCLIILGTALGFIFLWDDTHEAIRFLEFDSHTFFFFLLPPIILESAYSLKDKAFIENLGTVVVYAVVGTIMNITIIGGCLTLFSHLGLFFGFYMEPLDCLIFASLIAAVDPVAVLAIFQEVGVNKMLYFLVFGESLLNDAVTIVCYNLVKEFKELDTIRISDILLGFVAFLCVSLGGMAIGFACGFASAFITKYTHHVRVVEPVVLFGLAYLSYILAELFHFSGIIGIICCGLNQAQFACVNISPKSYISVNYFAKVGCSVTESLIFIILGVMLVNEQGLYWTNWHPLFSVYAVLLCIIARVLVVFFLTYIVNRFSGGNRFISFQEQFIMAYGGLRGAISFSLAFMLQDSIEIKRTMLSATYVVIIFTVFLQGCTIKPLVRLLDIRLARKEDNFKLFMEFNRGMCTHMLQGIEDICGAKHGTATWLTVTNKFSQRFLRPALHKNYVRGEKRNKLVRIDQEEKLRETMKTVPSNPSLHRQDALSEMAENGEVTVHLIEVEEEQQVIKKPKVARSVSDLTKDLSNIRALVKNPLQDFYHDVNLTDDENEKLKQLSHLQKMQRVAKLQSMQTTNGGGGGAGATHRRTIFKRRSSGNPQEIVSKGMLLTSLGSLAIGKATSFDEINDDKAPSSATHDGLMCKKFSIAESLTDGATGHELMVVTETDEC